MPTIHTLARAKASHYDSDILKGANPVPPARARNIRKFASKLYFWRRFVAKVTQRHAAISLK